MVEDAWMCSHHGLMALSADDGGWPLGIASDQIWIGFFKIHIRS